MKRPLLLTAAAVTLLLAACSESQKSEEVRLDAAEAPAAAAADAAASAPASPPSPAETAAPSPTIAVSIPMMAYSYRYGLEAPAAAVPQLLKAHEAACAAAGPAVCQMVGQSIRNTGRDRVYGELSLRAAPGWLARFRQGLDGQAKAAGGRVVENTTESEDLTRQIVDTEAALRSKTTLRDRLQSVLATRPGKLSDLLEVERELARVQQEIDATQSGLAVMRTRVATSALTITYRSEAVLAAEGVWAPLASAFGDVVGIIVGVLAGLVRLAALLLPFALLIGLVAWLFRGRLRWPKRRPRAPTPPAA